MTRQIESGPKKKKSEACRKFGLVNSTVLKIRKNGTKIISVLQQNGQKIKRLRKPERSDLDVALIKWLNSQGI